MTLRRNIVNSALPKFLASTAGTSSFRHQHARIPSSPVEDHGVDSCRGVRGKWNPDSVDGVAEMPHS